MKAFWIFLIIFFLCVNTLAAMSYAGAYEPSSGGFVSIRFDLALWEIAVVVSGLTAVILWIIFRPKKPKIHESLSYPVSYLATLFVLSLIVLILGKLNLLDRYNGPYHIPFLGYVLLLMLVYPIFGFITGRVSKGNWRDLLWGVLTAVILCGICTVIIYRVNLRDELWIEQMEPGANYGVGYTSRLLRGTLGGILAQINLPSCVLMESYEYAYYDYGRFGGVHSIPRDIMAYMVCAFPSILFSVGWAMAVILKKKNKYI